MTKCFADINTGSKGCRALKIKKCTRCNFYKTEEQAKRDREKALNRLKRLDKPTREYISKKYNLEGIV